MFFKDFFGMDEWPEDSYSSWSPRREQPFTRQVPCYSDYNPYYGYASPDSSRRRLVPGQDHARGHQSYYPFGNPIRTEIPVEQVQRNDRSHADQNQHPACTGCSECCLGYENRRPATNPSRASPHGNTGYRQQRNDSESSSEESSPDEIQSRFSPPSRGLKKHPPKKNSTLTDLRRISPPKKSTTVNSFRGNPINNGRVVGGAGESVKIQQPFAVNKSDGVEIPIVVNKSAEAEDVEEMSTEASIEQPLPSQNTEQNIPKNKTPTDILTEIELETAALDDRIKAYTGTTTKDREYIVIDELITKALLRLDAVESNGDSNIRSMRKSLVKRVQALLAQLEQKVGIVKTEDIQDDGGSDETGSSVDLGDTIMAEEANDCTDEPSAEYRSSEVDNSSSGVKELGICEVTEDMSVALAGE